MIYSLVETHRCIRGANNLYHRPDDGSIRHLRNVGLLYETTDRNVPEGCNLLETSQKNVPLGKTTPGKSSSSSSCSNRGGIGALVEPFRSHQSRSLFKGLPWFLLPSGV
jgi:hypothetical protein